MGTKRTKGTKGKSPETVEFGLNADTEDQRVNIESETENSIID